MKIVYVPQNLYAAIKKAGLRSQDLTDLEKLSSTLSPTDVAFYLFANLGFADERRKYNHPIPEELRESLPNILIGDATTPIRNLEAYPEVFQAFKEFRHANVNEIPPYCDKGALLTSDCTLEDLIIVTHHLPDPEVEQAEGVVPADDTLTAFYDRIIRQLLIFIKPEEVMAMPVLAGWMKSVK